MATILRFALVLALVAFLFACSTSKGGSCINPAAPGCGDNGNGGGGGGDPDQTGLDPLGAAAPKHYLKDSAGNNTVMWYRLLQVGPARRSVVTFGNEVCPAKCQQFLIEAGMDADSNAITPAMIQVSWSADCLTPTMPLLGAIVRTGETKIIGDNYVKFFRDFAPQCFHASGRYSLKDSLVEKEGSSSAVKLLYRLSQ